VKGLLAVRSWVVEDALAYLAEAAAGLGESPLLRRVGKRLEDIRLPLRAVAFDAGEDLQRAEELEHLRGLKEERPGGRRGRDYEDRRERIYAIYGERREEERERRPEPLDGLAPRLRHGVILGDPGNGKTEWLKEQWREAAGKAREALEAHKELPAGVALPVFLHLNDLAAALRDGDLGALVAELEGSRPGVLRDDQVAAAAIVAAVARRGHAAASIRVQRLLWRKLTAASDRAPVLLCLDGWDEAGEHQVQLRRHLRALCSKSPARVLLTSRLAGYGDNPLFEGRGRQDQRELRLCRFELGETKKFIAGFYADDPAVGAALIRELGEKQAVSGMAQNPLLATLLCIAYRPVPGQAPLALPLRRVELYERILEGLLGRWPHREAQAFEGPKREDLIAPKLWLLEAMAERFFPHQRLMEKDLHEFLWGDGGKHTGYLNSLPQTHPLHCRLKATGRTMEAELIEDGVLAPCGVDDYMFLHLTFQEYLEASALARRGWAGIAGMVDRKAWHPAWNEVVIMLAGRLERPEEVRALLERLADPRTDDIHQHRAILAAQCLDELKADHRTQVKPIVDRLTERIFGKVLGEYKTEGFFLKIDEWLLDHFAPALPPLVRANGTYEGEPVLAALERMLASGDWDVRRAAVAALYGIGGKAETNKILAVLKEELEIEHSRKGGERGIFSRRGQARYGSGTVAPTLTFLAVLERTLASACESVRKLAAQADKGLGARTPEISAILARLLESSDWEVRESAIHALGDIGEAAATDGALTELEQMLVSDDWRVRESVMRAVGHIGAAATTPRILTILEQALENDNWRVSDSAAWAVAGIGAAAATDGILAALARMLSKTDDGVRQAAARAVEGIGAAAATPQILTVLERALNSNAWDVLEPAVWALRGIGAAAATPVFLTRLGRMLESDEDNKSLVALWVVKNIGAAAATEEIITVPERKLVYGIGSICNFVAVEVVGDIGAGAATDKILTALERMLESGDDSERLQAAYAVGGIGAAAATDKILAALKCMLTSANELVRWRAADAVRGIGQAAAKPKFLTELAEVMTNEEARWPAASATGGIGAAAAIPEILAVLGRWLVTDFTRDHDLAWPIIKGIGPQAITPEVRAATTAALVDANTMAHEFSNRLSHFGYRWLRHGGSYVAKHVNDLSAWPPGATVTSSGS
jgi:HEAT repeat protein